MSNEQRYEMAKEYVDKQLETMKQFGSAPREKLSQEEYKALIDEVADTVTLK
jgi:hypothetical protein